MNQTILDLKILANIPQNGRICSSMRSSGIIDNSTIALEQHNSTIAWLKRLFSPDSRKKAIRDIKCIIERAFSFMDGLVNSKYINIYETKNNPSESEYDKFYEDMQNLGNFCSELKNSINGINNLKETTYKNDTSVQAEIDIIIRDINQKIIIIENKIQRINKNKEENQKLLE